MNEQVDWSMVESYVGIGNRANTQAFPDLKGKSLTLKKWQIEQKGT